MSEDLKADVMKAFQRADELVNINEQKHRKQGKSFGEPMKSRYSLFTREGFSNLQILHKYGNILGDES